MKKTISLLVLFSLVFPFSIISQKQETICLFENNNDISDFEISDDDVLKDGFTSDNHQIQTRNSVGRENAEALCTENFVFSNYFQFTYEINSSRLNNVRFAVVNLEKSALNTNLYIYQLN